MPASLQDPDQIGGLENRFDSNPAGSERATASDAPRNERVAEGVFFSESGARVSRGKLYAIPNDCACLTEVGVHVGVRSSLCSSSERTSGASRSGSRTKCRQASRELRLSVGTLVLRARSHGSLENANHDRRER